MKPIVGSQEALTSFTEYANSVSRVFKEAYEAIDVLGEQRGVLLDDIQEIEKRREELSLELSTLESLTEGKRLLELELVTLNAKIVEAKDKLGGVEILYGTTIESLKKEEGHLISSITETRSAFEELTDRQKDYVATLKQRKEKCKRKEKDLETIEMRLRKKYQRIGEDFIV